MNIFFKKIMLFTCLFLVLSVIANAQSLEDYLAKYTAENGKSYMQPLGDAFGANMNSGFFHSAQINKDGFQLYLGFVTTVAWITDDQRTFSAQTEGLFYPETTVKAPTIFGDAQGPSVEGVAGTVYNFPGGMDISMLPIVVPQVTVGSFWGTQVTLRYFNMDLGESMGKLTLGGFGVRHSVSQYFKDLPVDVAVGFYLQNFEIGDIVDAKASIFNIQGSLTKGLFTFYSGIGIESSQLDIKYTYEIEGQEEEVSFELTGSNSFRLTTGLTVNLGPFKINSDFNLAAQKVVVLGMGFEF